jgi:mRNA interferase YafQ
MLQEVVRTNCFKRSYKRCMKRGKPIEKLDDIIMELAAEKPLPAKNRDHALTGNYRGSRECHIEPDWLLIYRVEEQALILEDTGTHADLFD